MISIFRYKNFVFAGNGFVACEVLEILSKLEFKCEGVILHPDEKSKDKERLIRIAENISSKIWLPSEFNKFVQENIVDFSESILISAYFGYIFPESILSSFRMAINLHPSYLPFNKGSYTNVWPIIENTLAGVSIHRMTNEIDSGEIFVRKEVDIYSYDTGKTLYERLEKTAISLFEESIESILKDEIDDILPNKGGTYHIKDDVNLVDEIKLDKQYQAKELLDILRARTFDDYPSAYFIDSEKNRKVFIRLEFITENIDE